MRYGLKIVLLASALLATASLPLHAQEIRWHGDRVGVWHGGWHGDIHRFHEADYQHWRGGHWFHGRHGGRGGWWWIVGGVWYNYNAPIYPYPDPYTPPMLVVEPTAPVAVAPPAYVYYCGNPAGYYPYVNQCYTSWQKLLPNNAPPQAAPPPVAMAVVDRVEQRDANRLNALAAELGRIGSNSRHPRLALRSLEHRVAAFRATLYRRHYNNAEIVRNTDDLEHRIAEKRAMLGIR